MPPQTRAAKAHRKRLSAAAREKGKAPASNNDGAGAVVGKTVGLPSLDAADTLVNFPIASMSQLQLSAKPDRQEAGPVVPKQKYSAELLANPPIPPKNKEELAILKAAIAERARLNGDQRTMTMLNPHNPSLTLRILPYTPITPPGVAWRKVADHDPQSKKEKMREIREMLSGSEKLKNLFPDSDSDSEDEDEDEKEPTEDRTIHAPLAHRTRPHNKFGTLQEKMEVLYGLIKGNQILSTHADILHGQIQPKALAGYTRETDGYSIGVLTDWDGEITYDRVNEMLEMKEMVMNIAPHMQM